MSTIVAPAEVEIQEPAAGERVEYDRPWVVIVWNDPINLMSYVTLVFQKLFGFSLQKATQLMLEVHNEGKAVVSSGNREKSELDVSGCTRTGSGRRCSRTECFRDRSFSAGGTRCSCGSTSTSGSS